MAKQRIKSDYSVKHFVPYIYNRTKDIHPNLSKVKINQVLTMYYELCIKDLAEGHDIILPGRLGRLYLTKRKGEVTINEETGEIINKFPVNIHETLKLWKEKPEYKKKRFVRYTNDHSGNYTYALKYGIGDAAYENKNIYNFQFNKRVKQELNQAIHDKRTNAFIKKNYDE